MERRQRTKLDLNPPLEIGYKTLDRDYAVLPRTPHVHTSCPRTTRTNHRRHGGAHRLPGILVQDRYQWTPRPRWWCFRWVGSNGIYYY